LLAPYKNWVRQCFSRFSQARTPLTRPGTPRDQREHKGRQDRQWGLRGLSK